MSEHEEPPRRPTWAARPTPADGPAAPDGPAPDSPAPDSPAPDEPAATGDPLAAPPTAPPSIPPPAPPAPPRPHWRTRLDASLSTGFAKITGQALGPYQSAIIRIGFAGAWLVFLLREWTHRQELYGPDSPWGWDLAEELIANNNAFSVLMWTQSNAWFECVYALAILSSVALMIGWRTRTMSVIFMIGVLSLQNRSIFMGDGSDNVIHLMAIYLVLTRCAQVWSLDARRAARTAHAAVPVPVPDRDPTGLVLWAVSGVALTVVTVGPGLSPGWAVVYWGLWLVAALWWAVNRFAPGEPRTILDVFANLIHNGAIVVIMFEVCMIYSTAGWYKIQGSRWQDGTAAYYPMKLDYFAPWPELNDVFAGNGLIIMGMTYVTVMVQVAFPFTLFNRKVKNVLLALMIAEHLSIAVLLGLPIFSLAMIAADAVFLPTALLVWLGARSAGLTARVRGLRRGGDVPGAGAGATVPGQSRGGGQPGQPGQPVQPGHPGYDGQTERKRDADTTVTLPR